MVVNDHGHITTKTKDDQFDDTNGKAILRINIHDTDILFIVLFIWKNLQRKDGCYITLVSNNRQVGVDSIEDGEILKVSQQTKYHIYIYIYIFP